MMQITIVNSENTKQVKKAPTTFSRTNPFQAKVLKNIDLNGVGSSKETRHIELSLKGSDLSYIPGDALGILPSNDPELVASLLGGNEMGCRNGWLPLINKVIHFH